MATQTRLFSRDLIHKVNRDMIAGRSADVSGLPQSVQNFIREQRYTREEINRAFADARRRVEQAA